MRRPRVGKVRYINCEPVYYGIEEGAVAADCDLIEGNPAELNRMMAEGALDISVISSLAYARSPERYRLLPDLAIACDGAVGSVLFSSRLPFTALRGQQVLITRESLTSAYLLRILLQRAYAVEPLYLWSEVEEELPPGVAGCLLIGDPALRAGVERRYPHQLDLGWGWKAWSGLPFIFALWAVREAFYQERPEETHILHRALLASKAYSLARVEAISAAVHARVGISAEACLTYFRQQLSFDLSPRHLEGLERFLLMPEINGLAPVPVRWRFIE